MKIYKQPGTKSLRDIIGINTGGPQGRRMGESGHSSEDYAIFVDLITKMLHYDPQHRITPGNAIEHPFLARQSNDDSQRVPHNTGNSQGNGNGQGGPWGRRDTSQRPPSPNALRVSSLFCNSVQF